MPQRCQGWDEEGGGDGDSHESCENPHPLPRPDSSDGKFFARPNARELALNDLKLEDARDRATKSLETFRKKQMGVSENKGTPKWMVYDGNPH